MKRYMLFTMDQYYPRGGWNDFHDSYNTTEEAIEAVASTKCDHWHVVDSTTGEEVIYGRRQ